MDVKTEKGRPVKQEPRSGSTVPPQAVKGTIAVNGKEGKDFPEIRSSSIDVNGTPNWPAAGKPITGLDIDAGMLFTAIQARRAYY